MTQAQWDVLPLLLTRSQFCGVTGLRSCDLSGLVKSGEVLAQNFPASGYRQGLVRKCRYRKSDAARLAGLEM